MPDEEDFDDLFDEPLDLSTAIGDSEVLLRKAMGNERYDLFMDYQDQSAANSLAFEAANIRRIEALADAWNAARILLNTTTVALAVWPVARWVFGRIVK